MCFMAAIFPSLLTISSVKLSLCDVVRYLLKFVKVTIAGPSLIDCFTRKMTMFHVDFSAICVELSG